MATVAAEAVQPRNTRYRHHAIAAWTALIWTLLTVLALTAVLAARVTVCRENIENLEPIRFQHLLYSTCNFNVVGWIPLSIGALIILALLYLLAAYETSQYEAATVAIWRRPHRIPGRAFRALRRPDTPHRRKSITSLALFATLLVGFYLLVAFLHIAFE